MTRRVRRNMKKLVSKHESSKAAIHRASKGQTAAKGRVHCPLCENGSTKKLYQKNGQFRRECNRCNEEFWSVK
jgi:transposase-like protein